MKIFIDGHMPLAVDTCSNFTTLEISESDLYKLQDKINFYCFKLEFEKFLKQEHKNVCVTLEGASYDESWKKFWDIYVNLKDSFTPSTPQRSIFRAIYGEAKNIAGFYKECFYCGHGVFGMHPGLDANGHVFCDDCRERLLSDCCRCGCVFDIEELYHVKDYEFVCPDCLHKALKNGTMVLKSLR